MATDTAPTAQPMDALQPLEGRCNAKNRRGTLCTRPAGWGTSHVGYGNCRTHGGNTPNGKKHGAGKSLVAEALRLGASIEVSAEDLMLHTIWLTAGALDFAQKHAARIDPAETDSDAGRIAQARLADALDRSARVAKLAGDMKLSERQIRLAQRWGQAFSAVVEEAMGEFPDAFTQEMRTRFAARIQSGMARLERGEIEAPGE